jgi:hypothetical protein
MAFVAPFFHGVEYRRPSVSVDKKHKHEDRHEAAAEEQEDLK